MKALAVTPLQKDSVRLVDTPDPKPEQGQVLVRTLRVGICGTDYEINDGLYGAHPKSDDFLIIGHESFGQVEAVGPGVTGFQKGDYVVASVRRPCSHEWCKPCRNNQNDMCISGDFVERGINRHHGYCAQYYAEEARWLTKIPPEAREVGVLMEPMSVVEKAIHQTYKIQERLAWANECAVVLGGGTIGLLATLLLRLRGVETYVYDRSSADSYKARVIGEMGAQHVDASQVPLESLAKRLKRIDFILEATGFAPLAFDAAKRLSLNGVLCLTGISGGSRSMPIDVNKMNLDLVLGNRLIFGSVNANLSDFRSGAQHLGEIVKKWPGLLEKLITRRLPLKDFRHAFDGEKGHIKVVVEIGG